MTGFLQRGYPFQIRQVGDLAGRASCTAGVLQLTPENRCCPDQRAWRDMRCRWNRSMLSARGVLVKAEVDAAAPSPAGFLPSPVCAFWYSAFSANWLMTSSGTAVWYFTISAPAVFAATAIFFAMRKAAVVVHAGLGNDEHASSRRPFPPPVFPLAARCRVIRRSALHAAAHVRPAPPAGPYPSSCSRSRGTRPRARPPARTLSR